MNKDKNFEKLCTSLTPFLKEANLYDKLQEVISENKRIGKYQIILQTAIYLMEKEFFAKDYDSRFAEFGKCEKKSKKSC